MSEPQLVVELSQSDAISSTSNKSLENKAAESDPESAEEDVEHDCEYHDYPSSEVTESTDSDSDQDLWVQGRGRGRGQGRSRRGRKQTSEPDGEDLSAGWTEDVHLPDVTFDTERVGPQNMPECFDASTRELDYLNLFLDGEFWDLLCTNTNLYAAQVKALHPNRYYAKSVCCVCSHNYRLERKRQPASDYKDLHDKKRKSKFWCRHCHRYLCIRKGSTCCEDWHTKVQYWR